MAKRKKNKNKTKVISEARKYDLLETARDSLFDIINIKKESWGYENWVQLHVLMEAHHYHAARQLIMGFRNTKYSRLAIEMLNDIIRLTAELKGER